MNFLNAHRKEAITIAGVLLFMIAGGLAMLIMPSEKPEPNREVKQEVKPETKPEENKTTKEIYVYMTGAVKKPGVYKFPEGSRIFEVVEAAGGFTDKADTAALNLAETFSDEQHIHILAKGEQPRTNQLSKITVQPTNTNTQTSKRNVNLTNQNLVDINHASESELQRLNGVGPAIAKRIYEYRQKHGRFNSPEDLINVRGIGSVKLEKMRSQILIR